MSARGKFYIFLLLSTLLLLCCGLSMCTMAMLPNPQADSVAWQAMAQTASTSRLMAFFVALTGGQMCNVIPLLLIPVLLLFIFWRARPGGGW